MMIEAKFQPAINFPWTEMPPIPLGSVPTGLGTPDLYVLITEDERPLYRLDLYCGGEAHAFEAAVVWRDFVAIGFGEKVHLLSLVTGQVESFELGSYFGKIYTSERLLLVATAERLFGFVPAGQLQWVSDHLGIDGMIIERIDANIVYGCGEWDTPGEWRPFRIDLTTGKQV